MPCCNALHCSIHSIPPAPPLIHFQNFHWTLDWTKRYVILNKGSRACHRTCLPVHVEVIKMFHPILEKIQFNCCRVVQIIDSSSNMGKIWSCHDCVRVRSQQSNYSLLINKVKNKDKNKIKNFETTTHKIIFSETYSVTFSAIFTSCRRPRQKSTHESIGCSFIVRQPYAHCVHSIRGRIQHLKSCQQYLVPHNQFARLTFHETLDHWLVCELCSANALTIPDLWSTLLTGTKLWYLRFDAWCSITINFFLETYCRASVKRNGKNKCHICKPHNQLSSNLNRSKTQPTCTPGRLLSQLNQEGKTPHSAKDSPSTPVT